MIRIAELAGIHAGTGNILPHTYPARAETFAASQTLSFLLVKRQSPYTLTTKNTLDSV